MQITSDCLGSLVEALYHYLSLTTCIWLYRLLCKPFQADFLNDYVRADVEANRPLGKLAQDFTHLRLLTQRFSSKRQAVHLRRSHLR